MVFAGSYLRQLRQKVGHMLLLMPGASVLVRDPRGHILLGRRDDGRWSMPGGAAEEGGSFVATAVAELREEAGIVATEPELVPFACLSAADVHTLHYPNGDITHCFALWFLLDQWTGPVRPDGAEMLELRFFAPGEFPSSVLRPSLLSVELLERFERTGQFQVN